MLKILNKINGINNVVENNNLLEVEFDKNNILKTTPLTSNILPGVTRKKLIELAKKLNVQVYEDKFKENDVYDADNVFITNSSTIILEANKLNGKKLKASNNKILKNIKSEMLKIINNE